MRYRKIFTIFFLCPAVLMLFTACGTGQKNGITMYRPEGVYEKEEIPFAEDFHPAMSYDCGIQIHNDTVYLCGKSSEHISIFCTNLNTGETSLVDTGITGIPFGFCVTDTGYGIVVMNTADYVTNTTMYSITADGTVLDTAVLSNTWYAEESDPFVWYSDGTVYLTSENSGTLVRVNLTDMTVVPESLPDSVVSVTYDPDGKAHLLLSGLGTRNLYTIENGGFTEVYPDINFRAVFSDHVFVLNNEIYCYDSDGIKKHGETGAILDFIDSGLVYTNIEALTIKDIDDVFCLYRSPLTEELFFYRMNKAEEETIREKIQIKVTFAENGKSFVQLAASMFNAVSEEYHVVCDIHRSYGSEDYDALLNQFEKAILKGDVGDIIVYSDEEFLRKYTSAFLDLTGYVNPNQYFRCVMDSMKVDDVVYAMSPYFTVHTLVGSEEFFPAGMEWTTSGFIALSENLPAETHLLSVNSRSYMQEILLMNRLSDYIIGTENTFASDEFVSLLEHLKTYPEENQLHIRSADNAFQSGKCLLRNTDLSSIRAGRANPAILDRVSVEYYGVATPLTQIGTVSVPDPRSILIQPWDASILKEVEKAILASDIGITPNNDGKSLRLNFPPLTEERRKELVKDVRKKGEDAKVAIRSIRRDAMDAYKNDKKNGEITEDDLKASENDVQKLTDKFVKEIDGIISAKEKEIMEV